MDIALLDRLHATDEEPSEIAILLKNGEPLTAKDGTPCTISVLGEESKAYRREETAITRAMLRSRKDRLEPEDLLKNRVRQAAACVVAWSGFEIGGVSAPCTPDNVKAVLQHGWILTQVERRIASHADFFGQSSPDSSTTSAGTRSSVA